MGKIRILLTVPHLKSTASPFREMIALAKYLPKEDFGLTICSHRENGLSDTSPILMNFGCRVLVARFRPRGRSFRHYKSSLRDQKLIAGYGPFDIQHSLDYTSSPWEALLTRLQSRFFVFTQRNLGENSHKMGIRIKTCLASKTVAISDAVIEYLKNLGANLGKIKKIPLGIDYLGILCEKDSIPNSKPYILSIGHLERRKRHQDAIRALARLTSVAPDLNLLIAGEIHDPDYHAELKQLTIELGVDHRVQTLGVRKDILSLMHGALALLLCSESEAFGWVVVEAMSVGLPVISSEVGGPKEIITPGHTGFLVPTGNVEGYAKALRQVIFHPERARLIAQNASELVSQKYSARGMVMQYVDLYREIMGML
jgi:glycosyltransferase involved in cell wall biosynthesis